MGKNINLLKGFDKLIASNTDDIVNKQNILNENVEITSKNSDANTSKHLDANTSKSLDANTSKSLDANSAKSRISKSKKEKSKKSVPKNDSTEITNNNIDDNSASIVPKYKELKKCTLYIPDELMDSLAIMKVRTKRDLSDLTADAITEYLIKHKFLNA